MKRNGRNCKRGDRRPERGSWVRLDTVACGVTVLKSNKCGLHIFVNVEPKILPLRRSLTNIKPQSASSVISVQAIWKYKPVNNGGVETGCTGYTRRT